MINKFKSFFKHSDGASAAAFELAAAVTEAEAVAAVARAEENLVKAMAAHHTSHIAAALYYAEVITLFRNARADDRLAYALRQAAELRSQMTEYAVASSHIQEALRLYYAMSPQSTLDIANALRVAALNSEREAHAAWCKAEAFYTVTDVKDGIKEAQQHLEALKMHSQGSQTDTTTKRDEEQA